MEIVGTLDKSKPVNYDPQHDANSFSFSMIDREGKEVQVVCYDDYPNDFEKTDQIVVTGSMKDNVFYADDLLVKCPSKYQAKDISK